VKAKVIIAYGTINYFYYMGKGEQIPWHDHKVQGIGHGHVVITGKSLLEQHGLPGQIRTAEDDNIELMPDIAHQITALEDNTIISHLSVLKEMPAPKRVTRMLIDGAIVETLVDYEL
jgi:hypothetical protein